MQSCFGGVLDGVSLDRYYIHDVGIFNKAILLLYQNGSPVVCILVETSLSTPECGEIAIMVMLKKWPFFFAHEKRVSSVLFETAMMTGENEKHNDWKDGTSEDSLAGGTHKLDKPCSKCSNDSLWQSLLLFLVFD
jgi:hypothetical protein